MYNFQKAAFWNFSPKNFDLALFGKFRFLFLQSDNV